MQPQRPSPAPERKTGDILTSLGLTNRSRVNPGHYVLWVDRSYRVRIHEMARDYEVDGTGPIQNCEICTKKEHGVPAETPGPETVDQEQARAGEPKRERNRPNDTVDPKQSKSANGSPHGR